MGILPNRRVSNKTVKIIRGKCRNFPYKTGGGGFRKKLQRMTKTERGVMVIRYWWLYSKKETLICHNWIADLYVKKCQLKKYYMQKNYRKVMISVKNSWRRGQAKNYLSWQRGGGVQTPPHLHDIIFVQVMHLCSELNTE